MQRGPVLSCGADTIPEWVPKEARRYLQHTNQGKSIRAVARDAGCHASTILRQIRRYENRRDDPLVDEALRDLGQQLFPTRPPLTDKETPVMSAPIRHKNLKTDDTTLNREGRRILRRLCETGAVLAIAPEMEKAVVVRDLPSGQTARTAVVDRKVAQAMALKDWITCVKPGRIARYGITTAGRSALKRLLTDAENASGGFAEAQAQFGDQHRVWGEKTVSDNGSRRVVRYNVAESPLAALARRKDKTGTPFLTDDLVAAGERLREDFELAQMGPRVSQNWERFLTGGARGGFANDSGVGDGPTGARDRVSEALRDLGPGLGDVVLRCCCYLEGMETAERRMGWSARSGKIVLRIALQRLKRHYDDRYGPHGPLIG
ncbi:MAG: helix-turn-helix domain-containing protein [Marinosulfonomonas sp.]|nr:helix-turn-helix domain-containing protein [Marinosulfonomonas sp.]